MKYQIICLLLWSFKFEPCKLIFKKLITFYGQCVCRIMIPQANGPTFPRKLASRGNGPKVMGKPWFCGEMGSSFEETTWGKWISFIHRMQFSFKFSFNMQLIIHTMQTFLYQLFIHFLQHFFQFFIVKCCIL